MCGYEVVYEWKLTPTVFRPPTLMRHPDVLVAKPDAPPALPTDAGSPVYLAEALSSRAEGKVTMEACVEPDGRVAAVGIMHSTAGPVLTAATAKWLLGLRLTPAMKDGAAIGVCGVEIEHDWKLPE